MIRKYFLLVLVMPLVGCSGGGTVTPSTNITGNWTMTNIVTETNNPIHNIGVTTTAKCNIVDTSGSLTILFIILILLIKNLPIGT